MADDAVESDSGGPAGDTAQFAAATAARRSTWPNQIARHAHQRPDGIALRFAGRPLTWGQLNERVERTAVALHRCGVGPGDRVALLMLNRPEYLEIVFAVHRLGAIAVPINFRLMTSEIHHILRDCRPKVVCVEASLSAVVIQAAEDLPEAPELVSVGVPPTGLHLNSLAEATAAVTTTLPPTDVPEDSPALIMYTSGTTGRPKGAVLSHQNMLMQSLTLIRTLRLTGDDDISLCAAPMFHIAAMGVVGPVLLAGTTMVLLPSGNFDPGAVVDVLESERITNVFLVPTQWQAICALPGIGSRDLRLRTISWGAAPAPTTLLRRMAEVFPGAENVAVFGQTEMSPVTCALDGVDALRKIGSVGRPISTLAVRIVDDDMNDVPDGEVGEIVYRGPTMMQGYWENPAATAEAFAGGWFHSGDLVRRDDEGFIYVVDRKKDMVISGGENIYCAEVEDVLAAHPMVREVAVIGRPDPYWGEIPIAVVAARGPFSQADLDLWCNGKIARYKRPHALVLVDALPRNASGKVVKHELRESYA